MKKFTTAFFSLDWCKCMMNFFIGRMHLFCVFFIRLNVHRDIIIIIIIGWCVQNVMSELCFNRRTRFLIGSESIANLWFFQLYANRMQSQLQSRFRLSFALSFGASVPSAESTPYSISNYKLRYHVIAACSLVVASAFYFLLKKFLSLIVEICFLKFIWFVWPGCAASAQYTSVFVSLEYSFFVFILPLTCW